MAMTPAGKAADQTYDPTSMNAQSGIAVNEAIHDNLIYYFEMAANTTKTITFTGGCVGVLFMTHTSTGRNQALLIQGSNTTCSYALMTDSTFYTITVTNNKLAISHAGGTISCNFLVFGGRNSFTVS